MAIAFACAVAVLVAVAATAGAFSEPYKALVSTTGDKSERTDHLDITNTQGAAPQAVMSLPLSSVKAGDRLKVSSELEVTTDCIDSAGHCGHYSDGAVGHPYDYNPLVDTQLILASSPDATTGTPLTGLLEQRCRQQLPYRHHHCVPVFPSTTFDVPADASGLYVNLVASAWNPHGDAQPGDRLIVGEDEPDGSILEDKGRVNAVRLRPNASGGTGTLTTASPLTTSLPIGNASIANKVVFSQRLDNLKKNEQRWPRISTPTSARTRTPPRRTTSLQRPDQIVADPHRQPDVNEDQRPGEGCVDLAGPDHRANGFNCTHHDKTVSQSWWDSPCQTQKAGVIRMTGDAKKLYMNLVVGTQAKRATPQPGD